MKVLVFAFGVASVLFFLAIAGWMVAFTGNIGYFAKTVDSGAPALGWIASALVDIALLLLFGLQHTLMARAPFKAWLGRRVPAAAQRSCYVLASTAALALVFGCWQPIAIALWNFNSGWPHALFVLLFWAGWALVLVTSASVDPWDLLGLRQAWLHLAGREYAPVPFKDAWLYRVVRHPLMGSLIVAFWAAPTMTIGHTLFAAGMTAYILVGIRFEERDLVRSHGPAYTDYRRRVPMLLPWRRNR